MLPPPFSFLPADYYIKDNADIPAAYGDAFGGLRSTVAKSVKVTLTALAPHRLVQLESGGTTSLLGDGPATATFNEIFAEESRDLLATFKLAPAAQPLPVAAGSEAGLYDVARLEVEYVSPDTGRTVRISRTVQAARSSVPRAQVVPPAPLVVATAVRFAAAKVETL